MNKIKPNIRTGKRMIVKKKDLTNPLFLKKNDKIWKKINIISLLIIILVVAYFIIYSPWLQITSIKYRGPDSVDTEIIEKVVADQFNNNIFFIFPEKNIIFFQKSKLEKSFVDHPVIKNLRLTKGIKSITVYFETRQPALVINNQNFYWISDSDGFILAITDENNISNNLPLVSDPFHTYQVTDKIVYFELIDSLIFIWRQFLLYEADNLYPWRFVLGRNYSEIELYTNEGWRVIFNLDNEVSKQLSVLDKIIKTKIEDRSKLDYIDLRIDNWVYYQ